MASFSKSHSWRIVKEGIENEKLDIIYIQETKLTNSNVSTLRLIGIDGFNIARSRTLFVNWSDNISH